MSNPRVLIYLLRRDLRLHDNPIFHEFSRMASQSHAPFTHLLPLYIFPAQQVEVSGLLSSSSKSPYPEARSQIGKFWRCGPQRATFLAESVWDLKESLRKVGSDLDIRAGLLGDVVAQTIKGFKDAGADVHAIWMTSEEGTEEKREERAVRAAADRAGAGFKLWKDEKYFIDDDDVPAQDPRTIPDVFTKYRNTVEPLRDAPRKTLPAPTKLPPYPEKVPSAAPFEIPSSGKELAAALCKPLEANPDLKDVPAMPSGAKTAIPFSGGATSGHARLKHLLESGAMTRYKDTRNGMLGADFSSKLSAWLALGCLTAREVHFALLGFEDGTGDGAGGQGYGKGENKGTAHMRFELLWRDYMRLCTRKFGPRLFRAEGFRNDTAAKWKYDSEALGRWLRGTTGTGLVDASQRELFLTGYTSNRARQNVASYLAKHLELDWRLGAEWYERCLVDYDVSSNWGNWQYTAGVGNDPREGGGGRKFNPVKQANDYDAKSEYITTWVPEVRPLSAQEAWQCWTASDEQKKKIGLMAEKPLVRINYNARSGGGGRGGRGGRGRGGGRR